MRSLPFVLACSAVGLLLARHVAAESPARPFSAPATLGWASAIWTDGEDLLWVASGSGVHRVCRSGLTKLGPAIAGADAVAGKGAGAGATLVGAGAHGLLVRWARGSWDSVNAPTLNQEKIKSITVDARGRVLAAGESHALYVWDRDTWRTHRYPSGSKINGIVVGHDGTATLFGATTTLLIFQNDALRSVPIDVTPPLAGALIAGWMSPQTGLLWATNDQGFLASIDVRSGQARAIKSPLVGPLRAVTGVSTPEGDLVAHSGQADAALYDGQAFAPLGLSVRYPEGLALDVRGRAVYVASRDGLQRAPLNHPRLNAAMAALAPSSASDSDCLADAGGVPAPAPLAKRAHDPTESSAIEPRTVDVLRWPTLRFGAGYGFHPGEPKGIVSTFDLDINMGMRVGLTRSFALWPELGYSYITGGEAGGNFVTAGVGPIFGTPIIAVGWLPKVVVGDARGSFGFGMRNSIVGSFVYDIVSVELSHQLIHTSAATHHEGRVMFAFDVLPVAGYLLFTNLLYSMFPRTTQP